MNDQKQLISSLGEEMTIRQKRTMIFFIEATKHILQEDGYDHLTIREIAQRAGYNAATLYNSFLELGLPDQAFQDRSPKISNHLRLLQ